MQIINPIKERILKQLAQYKFLTVSQLVNLGVGHKSRVREGLKELTELELTKHAQYASVTRKRGQADRIHFLTKRAVKILIEELGYKDEQIRYPRSVNSIFKSDYFHRISTINTWIASEQWAKMLNFEMSFFHTYFDKLGSQRNQSETGALHSVTKIEFPDGHFVQPDAIFSYKKTDGKSKLWMLEVWNGNNTALILERMKELREAIYQGIPSDKYNLPIATRVINTFEFEGNMKAVIEKLKQDPLFKDDWIINTFYFGLAESIWQDFEHHYINLAGEKILISSI